MAERDPGNTIVPLTEAQKQKILESLNNRGGEFFSWEQLQSMMVKFGPTATVLDVMKALKQESQKRKPL